MRRFGTILWYALKLAVRDRQNVVFSFIFPIILMTLLGFAFGRGLPFSLDIGVVDHDHSELSRGLVNGIKTVPNLKVHQGTEKTELRALRKGDRRVVLVLPTGFQFGTIGLETSLIVYQDRTDPENTRQAMTIVRNAMAEIQAQTSQQDFNIDERPIRGRRFRFIDFMTPGILGMAIMNLGLQGSLGTIVVYRETGLLRRIRVTPIRLWQFLGSEATVRLSLCVLQVFVIMGLAITMFGVRVTGSFPALIVIALIGSAVFVNLGIVATAIARSFPAAVMAGIIITVPMIFLGGVFFPVEAMPWFLQPLIRLLPLTHLNNALRDVVIRGGTLASSGRELLILGVLAIVTFGAALWAFKWE